MEELADSFAGNEVASQAAWVAEPGSVFCRLLGARLKTMVAGATADTLMKALATFTLVTLLRAALWKIEVVASGLTLLIASPIAHEVPRYTFD
jgi:hypothetical protein